MIAMCRVLSVSKGAPNQSQPSRAHTPQATHPSQHHQRHNSSAHSVSDMHQFCSPPSAASAQGIGPAEQVTVHPNPAGATPTGARGWVGQAVQAEQHMHQVFE